MTTLIACLACFYAGYWLGGRMEALHWANRFISSVMKERP